MFIALKIFIVIENAMTDAPTYIIKDLGGVRNNSQTWYYVHTVCGAREEEAYKTILERLVSPFYLSCYAYIIIA